MKFLLLKGILHIPPLNPVETINCFRMMQLPEQQLWRHGLPGIQRATPETLVAIFEVMETIPREISCRIEKYLANGLLTLAQKESLLAGDDIKPFLVDSKAANFHSFSSRLAGDPIHVCVEHGDVLFPKYGDGQDFFRGDLVVVQHELSKELMPFVRDS